MIQVRRSGERGHAQHGWLDSRHTFSFADYHDSKHMGFRSLRVINEDRVAPGRGFGSHAHRDMEIVSYVLSGSLAHKDSMGHEERLGPNEIQRMSAGSGIVHSEYNASGTEPVHFLQIWIQPATTGEKPSYEQFAFNPDEKKGRLKTLASPQGGEGIARVNQNAWLYVAELAEGRQVTHELAAGRGAWLHVIRGGVVVNGEALGSGDAVAVTDEQRLSITGDSVDAAEILLFDLA